MRRKRKAQESRRQLVHASGILIIPFLIFFGLQLTQYLLGGILLVLVVLNFASNRKYENYPIISPLLGLVKWTKGLTGYFEREKESPMWGAIMFFLGVFLTVLIFSKEIAIPAIAILALADSASALIGKLYGKIKLPHNKALSLEGSLAFFVVAILILIFYLPLERTLLYGFILAVVETIPGIEDNLSVPILAGALVNL